ncbi:sigma-70 family RNA polymerase sigma factor [Bacteriovoracaceae bacterium]|nr:sigma-70 family RNA polymerase sigma factor [Bacteriovoracaceae bacterium]
MVNPFVNLTDEKLMKLYQNGEYTAFEVIYSRYEKKVHSYLKRRIKEDNDLGDTFQNIFVKLHKSRMNYNDKFEFPKWIYTICRSEVLDLYKKKSHQHIPFDEESMNFSNGVPENSIDIETENTLSRKEKEAVGLRFYSDKDFEEISKELNISEMNARKIVSRGVKKLRLKYKG